MIGVQNAKAYTVDDLTNAGWTEETSISNVENKFFVLTDASANFMLGQKTSLQDAGGRAFFYQQPTDPSLDLTEVSYIETCDNYYRFRNIEFDTFVMNTVWNHSSQFRTESIREKNGNWQNVEFSYDAGSWKIRSVQNNQYLGPNSSLAEGVEIGADKVDDAVGQYRIFSISKADFARLYLSHIGNSGSRDATMFIADNDFNRGTRNVWTGIETDAKVRVGGCEIWHFSTPVSQTISIPNGKYQLSVQALHGEGNMGSSFLYAKSGETEVKTSPTTETSSGGNFENQTNRLLADVNLGKISVEIEVLNGTLEVGYKQTANVWDVFTNFTLTYTDPYLSVIAKPFPADGALEADQWYVYDILSDGDYALSATEGVVYTQNDVLRSAISTTAAEDELSLTEGKLYIKSATTQTLTITPQSFSYLVTEPAITPTTGNYLTNISTVTFDFTGSSTDDLEASFAIVNASAKASLKKSGAEIAEGTLSLDGYVLTADFGSVSLDLSSEYTVELPADVVGYAGETLNTTASATYHTGALAEGVYYFQIRNTNTYMSRGGEWGTQAVISNYGIHFEAVLLLNGKYTLKCVDASLAAGSEKYLRYADGAARTNQASYNWEVEATEGGVYLKPDATHYLTTAIDNTYEYTYLPQTETEGEAVIWVPVSKVQYAANLVAAKDAESAAISTSAGISASSKAELEAILSTNYIGIDKTSQILNALMDGSVDNWTNKKYGASNQKDITAGDVAEIWAGAGGAYQTIKGLDEGIYKVAVRATWRPGSAANGNAVGDEVDINNWLYANSSQTQLMSWYAGGASIDSRADMKASGETYLNEVYVYVNDGEDLTIGIASPATMNDAAWLPFFGWTLTYYSDQVSEEDANTIIAQAETLAETIMQAAVNDDLNDALNTFKEAKTVVNYNALSSAIATATASKNAYVTALDYLTRVEALMNNTNFYTPAAKASVYDTPKNKYDARTLTTDEINSNYTYQAFSYSPESDRYLKNTAGNLLMPGWTINGNDATLNGSGFYQNTWSNEDASFNPPYYELWTNNTSLAATTVAGTIPGFVANAKYTVSAVVRVQGNDKVAGSITMQVGNGEKVDVTAGERIGTTNRYMKTFTASGSADGEGNLILTFDVAADSRISWLAFQNVMADIQASGTDYAALNAVIFDAENKIGFEAGEYAPYKNKAMMSTLAEAKAINQEVDNPQATVQGYTTALAAANWTANADEVNAIRWNKGDEDYSSEGETKVPTGGFVGSDANSRISHNPTSNTGLTGLTQSMALMVIANTNATYGETLGYTLPLKANTVYEFKFKYAGWGECGTPTITILKGNETIEPAPLFRPEKTGNNNTDAWEAASVVFKTTDAGDYKVRFSTSGGRDAFGDLELKKAPANYSANLKVNNGKLGTFIAPFDVVLPENVKAYSATSDAEKVILNKEYEGKETLPAGTPVIVYGDGVSVNETFYGIPTEDENQTVGALTGILADKNIPANAYVLQTQAGNQAFYQLEESAPGSLNRCYVTANSVGASARLTIRFAGEDPTAINALEAAEVEDGSLKDGKYLIDNKIILVKNGVRYSANGQKLN